MLQLAVLVEPGSLSCQLGHLKTLKRPTRPSSLVENIQYVLQGFITSFSSSLSMFNVLQGSLSCHSHSWCHPARDISHSHRQTAPVNSAKYISWSIVFIQAIQGDPSHSLTASIVVHSARYVSRSSTFIQAIRNRYVQQQSSKSFSIQHSLH